MKDVLEEIIDRALVDEYLKGLDTQILFYDTVLGK